MKKIEKIEKQSNEIKRISYMAEDGEEFSSEEECLKYEKTALFVLNSKLKRLAKKDYTYEFFISDTSDDYVEIFNIQNQEDLDNLKRYIHLVLQNNGASDEEINGCFYDVNNNRKDYVISGLTYGHEVMIFWNCESYCCWCYRDGSIQTYLDMTKEKILKKISNDKE